MADDRSTQPPPERAEGQAEEHAETVVLGIETSCDETAAALVALAADGTPRILANVVLSQLDEHAPYGGVVPEIAARAHIEHLDHLIEQAFAEAGRPLGAVDAVAATAGPGLIGGVIVGLMTGKALAAAWDKPFVAVNHLEGHALSPRLAAEVPFPYLLLLVSGGHTQLLIVEDVGHYRRLGTTIDDALGEAFDKTAKLMELGYPGGPAIEKLAAQGDEKRFDLPRPLRRTPGCNFSFSGLKTAVRQALDGLERASGADKADLAASFQRAAMEALVDRTANAIAAFRERYPGEETPALVVAGGVAANKRLRGALEALCADTGFRFTAPPLALCTDNAAMIAWAGLERFARGESSSLDTAPRARWPLDPDAQSPGLAGWGEGKAGAKA